MPQEMGVSGSGIHKLKAPMRDITLLSWRWPSIVCGEMVGAGAGSGSGNGNGNVHEHGNGNGNG